MVKFTAKPTLQFPRLVLPKRNSSCPEILEVGLKFAWKKSRARLEFAMKIAGARKKIGCHIWKSPGKIRTKAYKTPPISLPMFPSEPGSLVASSPGKFAGSPGKSPGIFRPCKEFWMQPSKFCLENLGARDQKTPPISLPMFTGSRGPWWEVRLEILLHARYMGY